MDFYKLDVDEVTSVAAELGVRAMPTFYFFKGGEKVGEVVGANPKAISVFTLFLGIFISSRLTVVMVTGCDHKV